MRQQDPAGREMETERGNRGSAKTNRSIRRNLEARLRRERRSRQYRGRAICPIPPSRHSPVEHADGCRSVVTLALLIACPTKVYHYHCHPLFPASAPNPLVLSRLSSSLLVSPRLGRPPALFALPFASQTTRDRSLLSSARPPFRRASRFRGTLARR